MESASGRDNAMKRRVLHVHRLDDVPLAAVFFASALARAAGVRAVAFDFASFAFCEIDELELRSLLIRDTKWKRRQKENRGERGGERILDVMSSLVTDER